MKGHTHIIGGVAAASAVMLLMEKTGHGPEFVTDAVTEAAVFLSTAAAGALIPDIDIKQSTISGKHKLISFIARIFFGHRKFTHSLLGLAAAGGILYLIALFVSIPYMGWIASGLLCGILSHILLDMLNPKGVQLLYPVKTMVSIGKIKTGGLLENIVASALLCGIALCWYLIVLH